MYGVIPKTRDFDNRAQKLEEIQRNNREMVNLKELYDQMNASFENLRNEVRELQQTVDTFKKDVFGDENEDEEAPTGFVNTFRLRLDGQRDEYYQLVEKYMNELDRKRLETIEQRIARLEEKPKININPTSKIPSLEFEKKVTKDEKYLKK